MAKPVQIWSAAPTPLTESLEVDASSVTRMVESAVAAGMHGLFLGGTCGEGACLTDRERVRLVRSAAEASSGRLRIAMQVSDNSVPRVLDNARAAADAGADVAVIAPPVTMMNATPDRIVGFLAEAAERCPLPVGIYELGTYRPIAIPEERIRDVYLLPGVEFVKDSSGSPSRRQAALAARNERPSLCLLNGMEFECLDYLQAGYDGFMFGGAVAVPLHLRRIADCWASGNVEEARRLDEDIKRILYGIYGGRKIACWLTGLKYCLVRRGMFSTAASFYEYPLNDECRAFIDSVVEERVES